MLSLREVVWAMNPVHDNLNSLLAFFRQTVSTFFEPTAIRIQLNIAESNDTIAIDPFMRRNLVLIVKEALNNIVKHADASVVSFTCEVEQQQLCISIQDNGKGMPETTSVLGNGIRNIERSGSHWRNVGDTNHSRPWRNIEHSNTLKPYHMKVVSLYPHG